MQPLKVSAIPMDMDQVRSLSLIIAGFVTVSVLAFASVWLLKMPRSEGSSNMPAAAALVGNSFIYSFNAVGVLNEAGSMGESTSPYWWLNSGGELIVQNDTGETMQGSAPLLNRWRLAYSLSNPRDTDGGLHPQNLFRLVSRNVWNNVELSARFYVAADNLSTSPNRNQSNGLLLMSRYTGDGQTLYYAGIRVDGTAVIKKKYRGVYFTMAQAPVFQGTYAIVPATSTSQDLLPHRTWIGLKSDSITDPDGSVTITLYAQTASGSWQQLLRATDDGGASVGRTPPIVGAQFVGVRTDFMDVKFSDFRARVL